VSIEPGALGSIDRIYHQSCSWFSCRQHGAAGELSLEANALPLSRGPIDAPLAVTARQDNYRANLLSRAYRPRAVDSSSQTCQASRCRGVRTCRLLPWSRGLVAISHRSRIPPEDARFENITSPSSQHANATIAFTRRDHSHRQTTGNKRPNFWAHLDQ
jgi:hypothetical protein